MSTHPEFPSETDADSQVTHVSGGIRINACVRTADQGLIWIVKMMERYSRHVPKPAFALNPHTWVEDENCTNPDPDHTHDVIEGFHVSFAGELENP